MNPYPSTHERTRRKALCLSLLFGKSSASPTRYLVPTLSPYAHPYPNPTVHRPWKAPTSLLINTRWLACYNDLTLVYSSRPADRVLTHHRAALHQDSAPAGSSACSLTSAQLVFVPPLSNSDTIQLAPN